MKRRSRLDCEDDEAVECNVKPLELHPVVGFCQDRSAGISKFFALSLRQLVQIGDTQFCFDDDIGRKPEASTEDFYANHLSQ